jgi:glycosyltransferase involved in cell wall biosynthesis
MSLSTAQPQQAVFAADGRLRIAIAICTHDRATLLGKTLEHLCKIDKPAAAEWLVLIVNNCCADRTDAVVSQFSERLPIHLVHEPEIGIAFARNCATAAAMRLGAHYIVWMDDDVVPCQTLLVSYERAFARADGTIMFGGPIDPLFEADPPRWLKQHFDVVTSAYGIIDPVGPASSQRALDMKVAGLPYGANFALKLNAIALPRFDTRLGNKGKYRSVGEETALLRALEQTGASGRWIPEARTQHFIPASKLNLAYIGRYYRSVGRTYAVEAGQQGQYWSKLGMLRCALHDFVSAGKYALLGRSRSARFLTRYVNANIALGRFLA